MAEEERGVTVRAFSVYGRPLEMVNSFIYLIAGDLGDGQRLASGGE